MFIIRFCFQHYFYLSLSKISKLSNVIKKFELNFYKQFSQDYVWFRVCYSVNQSFQNYLAPSRDQVITINLIGVLLLHSVVFHFTVISAYFKVCNNDNRSVTLSNVLLLLLLFLNMLILFDIFLDKLRVIALFVIILLVDATQQALSWSFRKIFLKSLSRSFCFLSICHDINMTCTQELVCSN